MARFFRNFRHIMFIPVTSIIININNNNGGYSLNNSIDHLLAGDPFHASRFLSFPPKLPPRPPQSTHSADTGNHELRGPYLGVAFELALRELLQLDGARDPGIHLEPQRHRVVGVRLPA